MPNKSLHWILIANTMVPSFQVDKFITVWKAGLPVAARPLGCPPLPAGHRGGRGAGLSLDQVRPPAF